MGRKEKDRIADFRELMGDFIPEKFTNWLIEHGFFSAPASTKYHGNYSGGLYDHSERVAKALLYFTDKLNLEWKSEFSPLIVGMFHDLCKIDTYKGVESLGWQYVTDTVLTGHGDKSIMLLASHMQLTEEEVMCIRYHMGAFSEKEEWDRYGKAIELYPNVLFTHTADMVASHICNT